MPPPRRACFADMLPRVGFVWGRLPRILYTDERDAAAMAGLTQVLGGFLRPDRVVTLLAGVFDELADRAAELADEPLVDWVVRLRVEAIEDPGAAPRLALAAAVPLSVWSVLFPSFPSSLWFSLPLWFTHSFHLTSLLGFVAGSCPYFSLMLKSYQMLTLCSTVQDGPCGHRRLCPSRVGHRYRLGLPDPISWCEYILPFLFHSHLYPVSQDSLGIYISDTITLLKCELDNH